MGTAADLEIDALAARVQVAMEAFYAEPTPDRLFLWERMASKLWAMQQTRRRDRLAGGFGDMGAPVWRGPLDRMPVL
jgi:hypothetical protein